jgi:hypothetical protein
MVGTALLALSALGTSSGCTIVTGCGQAVSCARLRYGVSFKWSRAAHISGHELLPTMPAMRNPALLTPAAARKAAHAGASVLTTDQNVRGFKSLRARHVFPGRDYARSPLTPMTTV